jgi:hypothetical protein
MCPYPWWSRRHLATVWRASVLADMGLPCGPRLNSLPAFNLGIETGQLAVVLGVMPVVYLVRAGLVYLVWLLQRALPRMV